MPQTLEAVFYHGDQDREDFVPSGTAVANGEIIDTGTIAGVCTTPGGIAIGKMGSLAVTGYFRIKKAVGGGVTFARGAIVYWNDTLNTAVAAPGANIFRLGIAEEAALNGDDHVKTKLNQLDVQAQ